MHGVTNILQRIRAILTTADHRTIYAATQRTQLCSAAQHRPHSPERRCGAAAQLYSHGAAPSILHCFTVRLRFLDTNQIIVQLG